nr:alpha-amylase family glycosyl hydrolase [uncultured Butyrivibrio sp.]
MSMIRKNFWNKTIKTVAAVTALTMTMTACGQKAVSDETVAEPTNQVESAEQSGTTNLSEPTDQSSSTTTTDGEENPASLNNSEPLPPINILDDKYRTTYEIFVYSFYDSDGDGIGDLKGVADKLDYINDGDDSTDTDLGCNEIWLMPISPSPTYHKYDVTDYMAIDPEYGTMEDFEALLAKCHERGVKVIIDTVLNHTSSQHPWFKEAAQFLRDNPDLQTIYTDRETFAPVPEVQEKCPYLYYYNFTNEQQTGFEKLAGTNWYYEARFWSGMPDLNLDNYMVKEEIAKITDFWLKKGVDGFRLDAVTSYYTDNDTKNIEFMTWLNDTIKAQNEDAYIVAEAWTNISTYSEYYKSGIDSFFDFNFSGSEGLIASVARGKKSPQSFIQAMADAESSFSENNENYIDAPFYTNHDMARSAGYYVGRGSKEKIKMAGALNLLMGGNAFIYYGEELGMNGSGKDENKRAPMQWTNDKSKEFDVSSLSEKEKAIAGPAGMCQGPKDMDKFEITCPGLDAQMADKDSVYNYYKKAIRLRNTFPVIARGKTQPIDVLAEDKVGAFVRYRNSGLSSDSNDYIVFNESGENIGVDGSVHTVLGAKDPLYGEAALLILINNSDETKTIDLSKWSGTGTNPELAYQLNVSEETSSLSGTQLSIPSYGIVVIK